MVNDSMDIFMDGFNLMASEFEESTNFFQKGINTL